MATFPILSIGPAYPIDPDGKLEDNVLRSPFEAGYEQTRPRYTRARRTWGVHYDSANPADVTTLQNWESATLVGGAVPFTWTHPKTGVTHTVRLTGPIQYVLVAGNYYDIRFELREV